MRFRGCLAQTIFFVSILFLLGGLAEGQKSSTGTPGPDPDRIVVVLWDVGGGNFFTPTAKILLDVIGANAAEVKLVSLHSDGTSAELQSFTCQDGSRISFSTRYNRGQTQSLEIRLYDAKGNLLASSKRKVN
ncbi:MAG: hypothetical protein ACE144_01435 [Thermodesulfobacteriota bacterium]